MPALALAGALVAIIREQPPMLPMLGLQLLLPMLPGIPTTAGPSSKLILLKLQIPA